MPLSSSHTIPALFHRPSPTTPSPFFLRLLLFAPLLSVSLSSDFSTNTFVRASYFLTRYSKCEAIFQALYRPKLFNKELLGVSIRNERIHSLLLLLRLVYVRSELSCKINRKIAFDLTIAFSLSVL